MPYGQHRPSDIGALVESFGNAFAATNNRRLQSRVAQRQTIDQGVIELANKHIWDTPEILDDPDFMKFYASKVGKDNANGMAEMVKAFANSPAGVLKKAFGPSAITQPDVPPEGPVFNPAAPDAQSQAIAAVAGPRLQAQTPVETAVGFDVGTGQLQAQSQKLAQDATPSAKEASGISLNEAKIKNMQERTKVAQERLAFDKSKPGPLTPQEKAAEAVAKNLAIKDQSPLEEKAPFWVLPNGRNPSPGMTRGNAARAGAVTLSPKAAEVRSALTASAHLLGRMEIGARKLYPDDSDVKAAGRATLYAKQHLEGSNPVLQDLETVNNIGLHLLRNVLNEKGNIRKDVVAKGEKNLFGYYETKTSARAKLKFWKDVFASGYLATGAPPPPQVRHFLRHASGTLGPIFEKGVIEPATVPWAAKSNQGVPKSSTVPSTSPDDAALNDAFLQ